MKVCYRCKTKTNNFSPSKVNKDGLSSWCRICYAKNSKRFNRTKNGLINRIYGNQRNNSRLRKHHYPTYSNKDLKNWLLSQPRFHKLFKDWKNSGYDKNLTPSVDRIDDYKSYSLENIQLMTWNDNVKKARKDIKNGINNKHSKKVVQYDLNNNIVGKFHSMAQAERETSIQKANIWKCCNNIRRFAGNYRWKYA